MAEFVQELETEGWLFKVGDVYSHPHQATCFKITGIELDDEGDLDNARINGCRVDRENYSLEIVDYDEVKKDEWVRSWHLNDYWALETI